MRGRAEIDAAPAIRTRLLVGFAAGAFSHILFQGGLGMLLYLTGLIPHLIWSLEPVPPLGVPTTLNNMFWDGLWGIVYAVAEPRLTARLGRRCGGLAFGLAPLLVYWFIVLPLKGSGVGGGFQADKAAIQLAFDLLFGFGIAVLYGIYGHRLHRQAGATALRAARREGA
jgi:hypothetical protein